MIYQFRVTSSPAQHASSYGVILIRQARYWLLWQNLPRHLVSLHFYHRSSWKQKIIKLNHHHRNAVCQSSSSECDATIKTFYLWFSPWFKFLTQNQTAHFLACYFACRRKCRRRSQGRVRVTFELFSDWLIFPRFLSGKIGRSSRLFFRGPK